MVMCILSCADTLAFEMKAGSNFSSSSSIKEETDEHKGNGGRYSSKSIGIMVVSGILILCLIGVGCLALRDVMLRRQSENSGAMKEEAFASMGGDPAKRDVLISLRQKYSSGATAGNGTASVSTPNKAGSER